MKRRNFITTILASFAAMGSGLLYGKPSISEPHDDGDHRDNLGDFACLYSCQSDKWDERRHDLKELAYQRMQLVAGYHKAIPINIREIVLPPTATSKEFQDIGVYLDKISTWRLDPLAITFPYSEVCGYFGLKYELIR